MCQDCNNFDSEHGDELVSYTIEEAVANGVKFLDATVPDWRARINVEALDMYSPRLCILGQLFSHEAFDSSSINGYEYALDAFGGTARADWADEHGFDACYTPYGADSLQVLWEEELSE